MYSESELLNASVYDLYGLYYGYVCGFNYTSDRVLVKICIKYGSKDTVPDTDVLKKRLLEKGFNVETDSLEYIVTYAREIGLNIPYKTVEREIVLVKSYIAPREILVIDKAYGAGFAGYIVLLKKPREAIYRGWRDEPRKPSPKPEYVSGKHVVSITRGYLGIAKEIVVAPSEHGLRIFRAGSGAGYVSWIRFLNDIKSRGFIEEYNVLSRYMDPLKHRRIELSQLNKVVNDLKNMGVREDLINMINQYIEEESGMYMDIGWSEIMYVNDIIVVR